MRTIALIGRIDEFMEYPTLEALMESDYGPKRG